MSRFPAAVLCTGWLFLHFAYAGELDAPGLERELQQITKGLDGRVGVCVQEGQRSACVRGDERFSMQSVVKLLVGFAVLDGVDSGRLALSDVVLVRKEDLSLAVQPLAKLVRPAGYRTNIGDLVRRAIIDSDSAATDILIARLGGPSAVQKALERKGVSGIRVDRDERHLQTEIVGLKWRPQFVDPAVLSRAVEAVPANGRQQSYLRYQKDVRDTSTPQGMAAFLEKLTRGELLSSASTDFLMQAMDECRTFPDRLQAGVSAGWQIAHKTGTSGSWQGVTAATNDVGVLKAPSGSRLSVAAFVADSRASSAERAAVIARVAAAAIGHYR